MNLLQRGITVFTAICAALALESHAQSAANCPFNIDGSRATNSRRATTDGLIFIRYALGITTSPNLPTGATETPSLTAAQIASLITTNKAALDIDGDGYFTPFDAQVIARYLLGYRNSNLAGDLTAPDFAKRFGSKALQDFIESGCNPASDPTDPRITAWTAMNAQLALGTLAGVAAAKAYLTDSAVDNLGPVFTALTAEHAAIIASYSTLVPRQVSSDYAEYWVSRPLIGGAAGARDVFTVTFVRTFDGSWRIDSM